MVSVFTHAQQEVEGDIAEVGLGLEVGIAGSLEGQMHHVFHQCQWDCQLGQSGRIFAAIVSQLVVQWGPVTFVGVWAMEGVWQASQFEGLADGAKRVLN